MRSHNKKRKYISIYFKDAVSDEKSKSYLTVAFDGEDDLYEKVHEMGSGKIKETLDVSSYQALVSKAERQNRKVGNYIKHVLKKKLLNGDE